MELFNIECEDCGYVSKLYVVETDWQFYSSSGGDWGIAFRCCGCGLWFLKMKFYSKISNLFDFGFKKLFSVVTQQLNLYGYNLTKCSVLDTD